MQALPLPLLLLALQYNVSSAADFDLPHQRIEKANDENRIIGGDFVSSNSLYPWFVAGSGGCGGALIADDVVLTAAHCAEGYFEKGSNVRVGSINKSSDGQVKTILQVLKHPQYTGLNTNDLVAYDLLLVKIAPTTGIAPISMNSNDAVPSSGQGVTVIGFGATDPRGSIYPNKMKHVTVKTLTHQQCVNQYGNGIVENAMLCAGAKGKDSCYGDSGGPLITSGSSLTLVGVVSFGAELCASDTQYGVYARVSGSYDWIKTEMCKMTDSNMAICGSGGGDIPTPPPTNPLSGSGGSTDLVITPPPDPPSDGGGAVTFAVTFQYDQYAEETGWYIYDYAVEDFIVNHYPGDYTTANGKKVYKNQPLQIGKTYQLVLEDTFGDGFCCSEGKKGFVLIRAMQDGVPIWQQKITGSFTSDPKWKNIDFTPL